MASGGPASERLDAGAGLCPTHWMVLAGRPRDLRAARSGAAPLDGTADQWIAAVQIILKKSGDLGRFPLGVQPVARAADNIDAVQGQFVEQGIEGWRFAGGVYLQLIDDRSDLVLEILRHGAIRAGLPGAGDGVHVAVEVVNCGQRFVDGWNGALRTADFAPVLGAKTQQARVGTARLDRGAAARGAGAEDAGDLVGQRPVGDGFAGLRRRRGLVQHGFAGHGFDQRAQGRGWLG